MTHGLRETWPVGVRGKGLWGADSVTPGSQLPVPEPQHRQRPKWQAAGSDHTAVPSTRGQSTWATYRAPPPTVAIGVHGPEVHPILPDSLLEVLGRLLHDPALHLLGTDLPVCVHVHPVCGQVWYHTEP